MVTAKTFISPPGVTCRFALPAHRIQKIVNPSGEFLTVHFETRTISFLQKNSQNFPKCSLSCCCEITCLTKPPVRIFLHDLIWYGTWQNMTQNSKTLMGMDDLKFDNDTYISRRLPKGIPELRNKMFEHILLYKFLHGCRLWWSGWRRARTWRRRSGPGWRPRFRTRWRRLETLIDWLLELEWLIYHTTRDCLIVPWETDLLRRDQLL